MANIPETPPRFPTPDNRAYVVPLEVKNRKLVFHMLLLIFEYNTSADRSALVFPGMDCVGFP
jgi:hypothetical protein